MARRKSGKRRSAAQRAAFKRMIAGLKRSKRTKRRSAPRRKRTRKHAARARRNPGAMIPMANALLVNPRRKRRRNKRRSHARKGRHLVRRRRNILVNGRKRRGHVRRRRNPISKAGIMAIVKETVKLAVPATIGGVLMGVIDSKIAPKNQIAQVAVKVGSAIAAGVIGKRFLGPTGAAAMSGAMMGTLGYSLGLKIAGGGMVVNKAALQNSAAAGTAGLGELFAMGAEDEELGALLAGEGPTGLIDGMGDDDGMGSAADLYAGLSADDDM